MRKRVTLASFLTFGCVLLGLAAANFFPDQTWRALNMAQTLYDGIISRIERGQAPSQHAAGFASKPHSADPNSAITVEEILANPQAYSHRMVKVRGCRWSWSFTELSGLELPDEFVSCDATGLGKWRLRLVDPPPRDAPVQQTDRNCIQLESSRVVLEQAPSSLNRPIGNEPELVHLLFHYDAQKDDAAWKKFVSLEGSQVSILAQFETAEGSERGIAYLGQHCSNELILKDVLRPAAPDSRR